jgi:hypothetical protein
VYLRFLSVSELKKPCPLTGKGILTPPGVPCSLFKYKVEKLRVFRFPKSASNLRLKLL